MFVATSVDDTTSRFELDGSNARLNEHEGIPSSLDDVINSKYESETEMFSIASYVQGHKPKKRRCLKNLRPIVKIIFNDRRGSPKNGVTLTALLDSGASSNIIQQQYVRKLKLRETTKGVQEWTTAAGVMHTYGKVRSMFIMPEFSHSSAVEYDFHVSKDSKIAPYDIIIGRDMMKDLGIDILFSQEQIVWNDIEVPFKEYGKKGLSDLFIAEPEKVQEMTNRVQKILDSNYHTADLKEVANSQTHLSSQERQELYELLMEFEDLFDGTLGEWTQEECKLELKPDAKPYHARAFPIPKIHLETLKKEVERLCEIGVLKRVNRSEWAAPTFIVPKKDGRVRFVSDFRELNKRIKRMPYPIPNIQEMMLNLEGFQYATALDLNMGYYHIKLDPDSRKLCTIILPFGKFEYQRLPQGLCNSPDIFQEKMSELFSGFEFVRAYIDDLLILTKDSFQDHLSKLRRVLIKLKEAGLKVNGPKSFFGRGELEYLGYNITREGIKPQDTKVEALRKIAAPTNVRELRRFVGIVNYYRDMWVGRSHKLAPLTALTSKDKKWNWTQECADAFNEIKDTITREVMLSYPDFTKPFHIHTDASHYQLGGVISQDGKPIAFYSRKLNDAQTRYTTTERELLSIIETLKEFKTILIGHKIIVYTDHKNLTCKNFNTERVMRWRLILEEFGPELRYIKGEDNVVADALSRLNMLSQYEYEVLYSDKDFFAAEEGLDFPEDYPLTLKEIVHEQAKDKTIQDKLETKKFVLEPRKHADHIYQVAVWKDNNGHDRIVVPKSLQKRASDWYHRTLIHPGETRLKSTLSQHYYWENMHLTTQKTVKTCRVCQETKKGKRTKHALLPAKTAEVEPWDTVCIDCIGPYIIGKGKHETRLRCMTMIDPATGWFEIAQVPAEHDKFNSAETAYQFEHVWLNRYPWPTKLVMDKGKEFMADVIKLCQNYGIARKPITTRNPQANAIVERIHQVIGNMIAAQQFRDKRDLINGEWDGTLSAIAKAVRSTVHTTLMATPSQLVFGRDALINVGFEADWQYIKSRKQARINYNNEKENAKRIPHEYKVDDQVMIHRHLSRKYGLDQYYGPWTIREVYDNGTLRLSKTTERGGVKYETWNIRNVKPYKA